MVLYVLVFVVILPTAIVGGIIYAIRRWAPPDITEVMERFLDRVRDRWDRFRNRKVAAPGPADKATDPQTPPHVAAAAAAEPVVIPPANIPDDVADPGEVAGVASSPISPDWAAVISRIAMYEPEDDAAFVGFMRSEAAAFPALADAWRSFADTCLSVIGLDPAAVQGTVELADVLGDSAHDVVLALRRFLTVYGQILQAVGEGVVLPHNAREFLTGGGA
jgi:hypothetical protein